MSDDLATIIVDGKEIEVPKGWTVLQACEEAGAEIPRFCYHERLSIAGNCRMCLVEWQGAPKPIASCAYGVRDLRPDRDGSPAKINTKTPLVKKAREGVMEFLLINHPLDCPICDQGGECDLQDQAMAYGHANYERFEENKRAVEDKYMGPLIKTIMTRCIHCTRCIRFGTEIAGVSELGATGRGEDMEITTYLEQAVSSELSGNVIDLCPVGALTSKPYAYKARPWELRKTQSVDVMDAVGSNIRVDARGREVMRVLPRLHEDINEEWLSDKSRFIWDGLNRQRLDKAYVRRDGKLTAANWGEAFGAVKERLGSAKPERVAALVGDQVDAEAVFALKKLMESLGVANLDCRQDGAALPAGLPRQGYLFNTTIAGIEEADALLIIGSNPRWEAPLINARIRKRYLQRGFKGIGVIGEQRDLNFGYDYLGAGPETLQDLIAGKHSFAEVLKSAERPMILVGMGALARPDGLAIYKLALQAAELAGALHAPAGDDEGWNGFNVLHTAASRVGALDLGFTPGEGGKTTEEILQACEAGEIDVVYCLGTDEIDTARFGDAFVIYQGTHGDRGAHRADVILPGAAYTEKNGLYVNTEGRVQMAWRAAFPPGEAREDWAILRALSGVLGKTLPFDNADALRQLLRQEAPSFATIDFAPGPIGAGPNLLQELMSVVDAAGAGKVMSEPFESPIRDFYLTNPIARASATMAECSRVILHGGAAQAAE